MAITIGLLQLLLTRKLTAEQRHPEQSCEFGIAGSESAAMELLVKSLSDLRFVRDIAVNVKDGTISARTRRSFVSFGEDIGITVTGGGKDQVWIKLSSAPAMKFTVLEYGKNYRNIEAIRRTLKRFGAVFVDVPSKLHNRDSSQVLR